MATKSVVVISGLVDATLRDGQPDVEFLIFHSIQNYIEYIDTTPVRAELLFFTNDVVGTSNASFNYLREALENNVYSHVDRVIYITSNEDPLTSFSYLVKEFELSNWEVIRGEMQRPFIQEVIHGTFREDTFNDKRKAIYRRPRADYIKSQLNKHDSLDEDYVADDADLSIAEDEEVPEVEIAERKHDLHKLHIVGVPSRERTAMVLLAAQYISQTSRVLIIESDPEYHLLTEFLTKANIQCQQFSLTRLYDDAAATFDAIRECQENLVAITCVDRLPFRYRYLTELYYYNLLEDFDYIIIEGGIEDIPEDTPVTVVLPSTVTGVLEGVEKIDKSFVPYCKFVGINLQDLPETHINSGLVISTIINDLLDVKGTECPVFTLTSLRLNGSAYDFGKLLGGIR